MTAFSNQEFSLVQLKGGFWQIFFLLTVLLSGFLSFSQKLELHPLFSDHMVLQQETKVNLWGKGNPGDSIIVEAGWGQVSSSKIDSTGGWMLKLPTPKYGGPYTLSFFSTNQQIVLKDILIGEVWFTSGQSNMEWPMIARIKNSKQEIQNASYPDIRMFNMPRNLDGVSVYDASWKRTNPENAKYFSAVAYFFARKLNETLNIPVGIVNSSWGGTRVEAWTSLDKLLQNPLSQEEASQIHKKGGLKALEKEISKQNKKIEAANSDYLNSNNYPYPLSVEEWLNFSLQDLDFTKPLFDDSQWTQYPLNEDDNSRFTFEKVFKPDTFSENGALWIRKTFDVNDPNLNFRFTAQDGIDDMDYTYINGQLVGQSIACCIDRSYDLPKGLLKKRGNVLAMRIIDIVGKGGFLGNASISSDKEQIRVDIGPLKFKHIAFSLDSHFQKHTLPYNELVNKDDTLQNFLKKGRIIQDPNTYSALFESMINPLIPFTIKGILWYQGESNVQNHSEYKSLFTSMIEDWRTHWGAELPFYFVQIAPCGTYKDHEESYALRDAQRKALEVNNTAMVVTLDIGEEHDIHPANKQDVGLRLANIALNKNYGEKEIIPMGPIYKGFSIEEQHLVLYFDTGGSELYAPYQLSGFELAGEDGKFYFANAKIINNTVRLFSKKVKSPIQARYAWANYFNATLFNKEGLPASSFITEKK